MIITSCGNSVVLAKKIAKQLKCKFSPLTIKSFPDGDIYLKYNTNLKKQKVVIVQSFQPHADMSLFDIIFAAETAKDLGAKKVILVAPYLGYMRQDKRFHSGECISSRVMAKLLNNSVDKLITIDPHIHRYKSLKDIFTIPAVNLTANNLIADYIEKHFKNEVIIGPDWESYQWAEAIAKRINVEATVLKKERFSSRHVEVKIVKKIPISMKNVVIVDDIISTGHTVIEAAKKAKQFGARSISVIGVHGLFVENALMKLRKAGIKNIITTNCIEGKTAKIDVGSLLVRELKKEKR
ncbi:MAG: ribose-phosphate diphosphokinase [Nanoarchaeota archaeon]|nr:ribose-phosphate diphosphokinase [Nanoarchaeota archaeon]MBU1621960.1 ribose-phosphate diphosphokinase [Nanoarchaeota archaeon]MBU1974333.1 ribose-phosphate diphosphokinase [Nanoarchaeota archaeon]